MKKLLIFFISVIFVLLGCRNKTTLPDSHQHEQVSADHTHEGEAANHTDKEEELGRTPKKADPGHAHEDLKVSPEKQKEWGITVGNPDLQEITSHVTLPGIVTLNQNRTANISALVPGQVASLYGDLGTKVTKNQPLLVLNSSDFAQIQADFLQTRAKLNLSRIEYDRAKMLLKSNAIGEKTYLRREAEYQKLSAEYGALGSRLHSLGISHDMIEDLIKKCAEMENEEFKCEIADPLLSIRSPLSGRVIFRDVVIGDHIVPEKVLFTVSDLTRLWAILDAYEKDIPAIRKDSEIVILSPLYPDREFAGNISYIHDLVDEKLRTVKIRVKLDNREGLLKPNMYIKGIIRNKTEGNLLLSIPETAVQNLEGEKVVFIQEDKDTFHVGHIILGEKIGTRRIVLSGLTLKDRIVIKGAFTLKTEISKGTLGHAHVH